MKHLNLCATLLLLIVFVLPCVCNAQQVPASVEREILAYLKQEPGCASTCMQFSVERMKIGPRRYGFMGSCHCGGGISVVFEKNAKGLRKLLQVDVAMNGWLGPSNISNKGYYDLAECGSSGGQIYCTRYRWNGRRYVKHSSDL